MRRNPEETEHLLAQSAVALGAMETGMDAFMRIVFVVGSVMTTFQFIRPIIISSVLENDYGYFWNYVDAFGSLVASIVGYMAVSSMPRYKENKIGLASLDLFAFAQLTAGTTLTLLASVSHFSNETNELFAPLGAITFAVCMLACAIKEAFFLVDAVKKSDLNFLLTDRLIRSAYYENQLARLAQDNVDTGRTETQAQQRFYFLQFKAIARARYLNGITKKLNHTALQCLLDSQLRDSSSMRRLADATFDLGSVDDHNFVRFMEKKYSARIPTTCLWFDHLVNGHFGYDVDCR